jgi:hypothetical protein
MTRDKGRKSISILSNTPTTPAVLMMTHNNRSAARTSRCLPSSDAPVHERQPYSQAFPLSSAQGTESEVDAGESPLPAQFFVPAHESLQVWTGGRRLMLSVLEEAVRVFFQHRFARSSWGKKLFRETEKWFWSTDRHWLFSFESICDHLNLNPDYLRGGLQCWSHTPKGIKSFVRTRHNKATGPIFFHLGADPAIRNPRGSRSSSSSLNTKTGGEA